MSIGTIQAREEPRYEILGEQLATLMIEPDDHRAEPMTISARLLNLSTSGCKLGVPMRLPREKQLRIQLVVEQLGLSFYLSAEVCWSAGDAADSCTIGCRFTPKIPEGILKHVSQGGRLDRREDDRKPVEKDVVVVRSGLLRTRYDEAKLRNYADGGLCYEGSQPARLGERLTVRIDDAEVVVLVRWQMQRLDRYLVGCEFAPSN